MNELEKQSLDVVANNALRYILEYGKDEGVVELVAQLLQLQVGIMQAVSAVDRGLMPQNIPAPTQMSDDMRRAMGLKQAQIALAAARQWNTQGEGGKNVE